MTKTLKTTLILTCILAGFQALAANNEFSLDTAKIGDQIVGKRDDGQFFSINCEWTPRIGLNGPYKKFSAKMAFPNSSGDILMQIKSVVREIEVSKVYPLSDEAADTVCKSPFGTYTFRSENSGIELSSTGPRKIGSAPKGVKLEIGEKMVVRTGLVDNVLVDATVAAATDDNRFFAIACSRGFVKSSAVLLYPNRAGRILTKEYSKSSALNPFKFGPTTAETEITYIPLSDTAMNKVCNNPNGLYVLQVLGNENQSWIELVGGQTFEAQVRYDKDGNAINVRGF